MKMKTFFTLIIGILLGSNVAYSQGTTCPTADPFCTGTTYTFPNNTGVADAGDYDCLLSTPNPAWYYLQIANTGPLTINIEQTDNGGNGIDVDFAIWGPFTSTAAACATNLQATSAVDCSYSTAAQETCVIPNAVAGEWYMLLLTNYADDPGTIEFSQTGGSGSTNCAILCNMTGLTATPSACNPANNQYSLSGTITVTTPPTTGTLTITNSCGGSQTINPPFGASINYSIPALTSNGAACSVTATFSADPSCTLTQNFTAPASCVSTPCLITNYTANVGACNAATNQYSTTGTVTFNNRPATGNLVIVDCNGTQQTYPVASVTSPFNYTLAGQNANGAACSIQAYFSADPACTATINYTAPICPCNIDNFTANISSCQASNSTYTITGTVEYTSPPATGTLTITVNNGTSTFDTIINAPFTSPDNWSISNIPANGANSTVTVTFSANAGCTSSITYTAPAGCSCVANIGTFTTTMTGNSNVNYVLCFGDQISVTANGNYTPPDLANNPPGPTYDPGIAWLVYSCPPTVAVNPDPITTVPSDPCFLGILDFTNFTEINDLSLLNAFPPGTFTNNTIYFVPLTMYSIVDGIYSYVNTTMPCYDMGTPISVTFLTNITHTETQSCSAGTVTTTITGGLPALNGSQFTAVAGSLTPATASFANTTASNGGTITIQGLTTGPFSFQVEDANGCPITVSGTFTGAGNAAFSYPNNSYCNANPSIAATITGTPGGTFTATPAGLSLNATTGAINIAASAPATYTITYTTPGAICPGTSTFTLTIHPMPTLSIAGIDVSCFGANNGQTIVIPNAGTAPFNYSWTGGCTSASCTNLAPGSYTVTVTDANGCTATADTLISQPPQLVASITGTTPTTCNGACDGTATANAIGGTGALAYSWNTIPAQATATATGLCAGTYTCTVTDANSCTSTITATITQPTLVVLTPIPNATICNGGTTNLTASATGGAGGYTFTWSPATGLSATTGATVTANPTVTTTYTVNATDANGCPAAPITVTVTVSPLLSVIANGTASICPGVNTLISAVASNGNGGPYSYSWSPTTGLANATAASTNASPAVTTTYTVTASDGCSPTATTTVTVTVLPVPVVNLSADTTSGCAPLCVSFTDLSSVATGTINTWAWNFGGDGTSTSQNPSHCFNTAGLYSISLTVTSGAGCSNDTTITNMINVFANPVAAFSWTPRPASILEPTVYFYNQSSSDVITWDWTFGDGNTSTQINPINTYPDAEGANYIATLFVTNANGCVDSVQNVVEVLPEFTFFIPNAFTPNGDGINDDFNGKGIGITKYELYIFDRWGNMIFFTDSLYKNWDGKANHGSEAAQQDVYVWKVKLTDVFDKKHNYIGTVTIVK